MAHSVTEKVVREMFTKVKLMAQRSGVRGAEKWVMVEPQDGRGSWYIQTEGPAMRDFEGVETLVIWLGIQRPEAARTLHSLYVTLQLTSAYEGWVKWQNKIRGRRE